MSEKNTKYTATLTLTQDGLEGDVYSNLKFDPLIDQNNQDDEGNLVIPASYELMSVAAEAFLHSAGILDENGNILDEEELHNTVSIEAGTKIN